MSVLRSALALILALGGSHAIAEQITCESHGGRAEACGTVVPGSNVQMVEQISNSPCVQGSTWGADNDSIWVSNGCRAVFDVQPGYSHASSDYDNGVYDNGGRYSGTRAYASDDSARQIANSACINRVTSDQPIAEDEIGTSNVRRVNDDLFVVELSTPNGNTGARPQANGADPSIALDSDNTAYYATSTTNR